MALPLVSIIWIALKQLSKPMSRSLARRSQHNKLLRSYCLLPLGQLYHKFETRARMLNQGFKWPKTIPPLNEETAIQYSSEMVAEFLIFLVAITPVLMTWYQSSTQTSQAKSSHKKTMEESVETLSNHIMDITLELDRQDAELRSFSRRLGDLDTRIGKMELNNNKKQTHSWYHFW
ncbi:optic atrophy 3 protein homolog [Convolutriloba macropyga]|uniref:optic atrophy 3 protein homolog n=1 Tax=Convolutriloba macropyga TaxID=536237 RepID=UPI003F51FED2